MINLYACGGAGSNIVGKYLEGTCNHYYIDTSTSNLKNINADNVFIVDGMDGAGKLRTTTYENFKDISTDVLIKFKPSPTLNIVISSLAGGSGSVIAPMLVKALLNEGKNVIVFAIESINSVIEINNTIKTLMSYKSISNSLQKSISIVYFENKNRQDSDNQCLWTIELLSLLTDKNRTEEFDISDLHNFLNFDKVTDQNGDIGFVELSSNIEIIPTKGTHVISSILLTKDKNTSIHTVIPDYLATCIITDKSFINEDIRIDNILGSLAVKIDKLEQIIKTLVDNKTINKIKNITVQSDNSHGMIL